MLIFVLLATMFTANEFTANDLKRYCASDVLSDRTFCLGYLKGFSDGVAVAMVIEAGEVGNEVAETNRGLIKGCDRDARTVEQNRLVFLKYVDNHPEELHFPAGFILSRSLVAAFPCHTDKGT